MRRLLACAIALVGAGCHCFVGDDYTGKTHRCVCSARCADGEATEDVAADVCVRDGDDVNEDAVCTSTIACDGYSSCECTCEATDEDCEHEGNPARCS